MIEIIRIAGEVFDLRSGQETDKVAILTNGIREVEMAISDMQLRTILQLWGEKVSMAEGVPTEPSVVEKPDVTYPEVSKFLPNQEPPEVFETQVPSRDELAGDEDSLGVGEIYNDHLTGTASI